jgi:hypothetical protein
MTVTSFGTEYDLEFIASGRYNDRIGDKIVLICVDRKELMFQKNDPHYPRKRKKKTSRNAKKTRNITRKG